MASLASLSLEELRQHHTKVKKNLETLHYHRSLAKIKYEEAVEIERIVSEVISQRETELKNQLIKAEVENKGYACRLDPEKTPIEGLQMLQLPLFVDKEPPCHMSTRQRDWVQRLGFHYCPVSSPKFEQVIKRDYSDRESSMGVVKICVYYKAQPCPPHGTRWEAIDTERGVGWVKSWEVKDGDLICDGESVATIEDWDSINEEFGHLILPGSQTGLEKTN